MENCSTLRGGSRRQLLSHCFEGLCLLVLFFLFGSEGLLAGFRIVLLVS